MLSVALLNFVVAVFFILLFTFVLQLCRLRLIRHGNGPLTTPPGPGTDAIIARYTRSTI
jgi:hypothetical protein